jgi:hypothetical protein
MLEEHNFDDAVLVSWNLYAGVARMTGSYCGVKMQSEANVDFARKSTQAAGWL